MFPRGAAIVHTCVRKHEGLGRTEDFTRNHQSGQTWNGHFLGLAQKVSVPDSPWSVAGVKTEAAAPNLLMVQRGMTEAAIYSDRNNIALELSVNQLLYMLLLQKV